MVAGLNEPIMGSRHSTFLEQSRTGIPAVPIWFFDGCDYEKMDGPQEQHSWKTQRVNRREMISTLPQFGAVAMWNLTRWLTAKSPIHWRAWLAGRSTIA